MAFADNVIEIGCHGPKRLPELAMRKRALLGELVIGTGAANLSTDALAGALLEAAETRCSDQIAAWARRGGAFFADEAQGAL